MTKTHLVTDSNNITL